MLADYDCMHASWATSRAWERLAGLDAWLFGSGRGLVCQPCPCQRLPVTFGLQVPAATFAPAMVCSVEVWCVSTTPTVPFTSRPHHQQVSGVGPAYAARTQIRRCCRWPVMPLSPVVARAQTYGACAPEVARTSHMYIYPGSPNFSYN